MRIDHVKTLCYHKQHKLQFLYTNNLCVYNSLKKTYIIAKLCILNPANKYNMTSSTYCPNIGEKQYFRFRNSQLRLSISCNTSFLSYGIGKLKNRVV